MDSLFDQLRLFQEYSRYVKGNTPKTVKDIGKVFLHFSESLDIEDGSSFTTENIEMWISRNRQIHDWKPKTIRTRLTYLSLFADWLVRKGYLKDNPVKAVARPRLPKRLPRALSAPDCDSLMDWTKSFPFETRYERLRAVAIIATFISTGLRISELRNLKISDVDMERMVIFVDSGKGEKDRKIPFRCSLKIHLDRYVDERRRKQMTCPYFFTSLHLNAKMGPKTIYRLCKRLKDESGLKFTPHAFRHTYATRMLESGLSIREVQELLGHSHISTTAIYLTVTGDRLREQVLAKGFDI